MKEDLCRFRPPENGSLLIWEITNLCNLECRHCCNSSSPREDIKREVKSKQAIRTARSLQDLGISEVYFSGGEPFTRRDFIDILLAIDTKKVSTYVATNGILISEDLACRLSNIGIKRLTISLDGFDDATHNKLRNSASAFDKTVTGIKNCVKYGIPVRISGVLTPENIGTLHKFIDFVGSLEVEALVIHALLPVGRAAENRSLFIESDPTGNVTEIINKKRLEFPKLTIDHSLEGSGSQAKPGCNAGKHLIHITNNGDISPCSWLYKINKEKFTLGNLNTDTLAVALSRNDQVLTPVLSGIKNCPIPNLQKET